MTIYFYHKQYTEIWIEYFELSWTAAYTVTSSNGNIFRVTGLFCGEFTGRRLIPGTQRPVTRSFDALFDLRLNKRLRKKS